jgi:signal transduction histidine kinase
MSGSPPASSPLAAFERQNRARLAEVTALLLLTVGALYLLAYSGVLVFDQSLHQAPFYVIDGIIASGMILLAIGRRAAQRANLGQAAAVMISALLLDITALVSACVLVPAVQPLALIGLGAYPMTIALAGVLGAPWLVIVTTGASNVLSLGCIIDMQLANDASSQPVTTIAVLLPQAVLQQWVTAGIMLAGIALVRRLRERLHTTQSAVDQARKIDDIKDQFITNVNHELRNPIMALLGYVEMVRLTPVERDPEGHELFIERALRSGKNLRTLLDSILDVRRVDQDPANFTPVAVNVLAVYTAARQLLDPRDGRTDQRTFQVELPPQLTIWGNPTYLQQILVNLLDNAVKYSGPEFPIVVTARQVAAQPMGRGRRAAATPPRTEVEITVRDYGLGVPPALHDVLFQRFVRLPRDLASRVVGNGLGLYLCRILCEAMGGSITVNSTGIPGQGSAFTVRLPAAPSEAASDHAGD